MAKSDLQALSEERLQTFVCAGNSWASYVHLVKHTKDFPKQKKAHHFAESHLQVYENENIRRMLPLKQNPQDLKTMEGNGVSATMAAHSRLLPPSYQQSLAIPIQKPAESLFALKPVRLWQCPLLLSLLDSTFSVQHLFQRMEPHSATSPKL